MNALILILLFLVYIKLFLFWLWLWQLKEYHLGRFLAHFEEQKLKKIFSSLWRLKYPKFTLKVTIIFLTGFALGLWMIINRFYFSVYLLIIIVPLVFQILTAVLRRRILIKARKKGGEFKHLLVIGITGSYGKTSTKEFLAAILAEKLGQKVLKTREHQNSEMGISNCILQELKPEHEIFICEMGAYNKGGIKLLCDIVQPKIGIVTGVNEQHLATFGSMENLLSAEGGKELIESLPKNGLAFFNAKNKYCLELYEKTKIKKFLYGQEAVFPGNENILGAMAVAKELGITDEELNRVAEKIKNKFPGIEIKKGINGLTVIDATYSANPTGVLAHLEYLKTFPGQKVIIMPCLIELGEASGRVHKEIGKKIGEVCDLAIITTKDRFAEIKQQAGEKAFLIERPLEIFEKVKDFCRPDNVILLESRLPNKLIQKLIIDNDL